ncbi:carbon starvation CstA family protein [Syntrophomonas curvata]
MNALIWLVGGYGVLLASHFMTKEPIERLLPPDPNRPTPASLAGNSRDYASNHSVIVAGQYFMAIAGLSPILSAIVGLYWGWIPAIVWLLLGVTFLGTPTEYIHMMASVRQNGATMGEITRSIIGEGTGVVTTLALWFLGTITYAIFMTTMAKTMETVPMAAIPTIMLTVIAICFGYLRAYKGISVAKGTIVSLIVWVFFIYLGIKHPISLSYNTWVIILICYTFIAAYLPVWMILAPRDFLNSGVLVGGIGLITIALLIGMPKFIFPAFVGWESARGFLWPAIMGTITCGAINATHSMMSAGIASRQLSNEKHAFGVVSFGTKGETVLCIATIGLIASQFGYDGFISSVVTNAGGAFSTAFSNVASQYMGIPKSIGMTIGALTLTGFVITTMDAYARGARYSVEELANHIPVLDSLQLKKPIVSTFFVVLVGTLLAFYTPFSQLWAGFALVSLTFAIFPYGIMVIRKLESGQAFDGHFYRWIIIPGAFMWISSAAALAFFVYSFFAKAQFVPAGMSIFITVLFVLGTIQIYNKINQLKSGAPMPPSNAAVGQ